MGINELAVVMMIMNVEIWMVVGDLQRFQPPTKPDGSLSVLVIGDWGRKGDYNQSLLATQVCIYINIYIHIFTHTHTHEYINFYL